MFNFLIDLIFLIKNLYFFLIFEKLCVELFVPLIQKEPLKSLRPKVLAMSKKLRHRGQIGVEFFLILMQYCLMKE